MKKRNKFRFCNYFLKPKHPLQKQYEALRAYYCDDLTKEEVASKFEYSLDTINPLISRFETGKIKHLLPEKKKGPMKPNTKEITIRKIIALRKKNISTEEIYEQISREISIRTIQRILKQEGFVRLPKRTNLEKGLTKSGTTIPPKSYKLDWEKIADKTIKCKVAGIFLFIPYLLRIDFHKLVKQSGFPETSDISNLSSVLSILCLKLIGHERLSRIKDYGFDEGFGLFVELNALPKTTCTTAYTYGIDKDMTMNFMKQFVKKMDSLSQENYPSNVINLDFHTMHHYGEIDNEVLGKHWDGAKNKLLTGALTLLAQDSDSKLLTYCNADIKKEDVKKEILNFVDYWLEIKGVFKGTLVFDCKLTNYTCLNELNQQDPKIKFITLRSRRGKKMIEEAESIPPEKWTKVDLKVPRRKFNKIKVYEKEIEDLKGYEGRIRQIIIKDNGREDPTFIITNNWDLTLKEVVLIYSKRWRVENKIAELIKFFTLNALNSPIMIRIFFDILLTMVADSLYRLLAKDLKGHESKTPQTLFTEFIDSSGRIKITEKQIIVILRRKAHSPILKSNSIFKDEYAVPWLDNRKLSFQWKN